MDWWIAPYCVAGLLALLLFVLPNRRDACRASGTRRRHRTPSLHGPTGSVRSARKPDWVWEALIEIAGHCPPGTDCRTIAALFNRRFAASRGMTVGKSFVAGVLREHRYAVADLRRRHKYRVPAALATNAVWAIDMTGKGDAQGHIHAILGILDHGARNLLRLDKLVRRTSWTLLGHLCLAIAEHGKPAALRSDNEACLTSRTFRTALALMGIRHQRTAPGCPWQNGRIERLFGTLKQKLDLVQIADAQELSTLLASFRFWYNAIRPHQHLGGRTPDETWHGIDPYAQPPRDVRWFSAWGGMLAGFEFRR